MSIVAPLMDRAVAEGVFPYGEWALFDKTGVREAGATEGEGGRWFDLDFRRTHIEHGCTVTAHLALRFALVHNIALLYNHYYITKALYCQ